jgi:ABC-type amino acid transport system permease subunit
MTLTISLWMLAYGAVAGVFAAFVAKGRNRLVKAAAAGAVAVFLLDLARSLF